MNILIAGIISVIMLLFGGARYYIHRHYNPQDVAAALDQPRRRQQQVRDVDALYETAQERVERLQIEMTQNFLKTLTSYGDYHLIGTAYELNNFISLCPEEIDHCKIRLSQGFTEDRVRQILKFRYTPEQINSIANNFIREPEGDHD